MRKVALLALLFALSQPACTISVKSHGQELVPSWVSILATIILVLGIIYLLIRRRNK
jgi:hypothetical protein